MTKRDKRNKVILQRTKLRADRKKKRAGEYTKFLVFAKENPAPKLAKVKRCRARNAVQIAECTDFEMLVLCYPKLQKYFPDNGNVENAFQKAKEQITENLGWRLDGRAGRTVERPLPPPQVPPPKSGRTANA